MQIDIIIFRMANCFEAWYGLACGAHLKAWKSLCDGPWVDIGGSHMWLRWFTHIMGYGLPLTVTKSMHSTGIFITFSHFITARGESIAIWKAADPRKWKYELTDPHPNIVQSCHPHLVPISLPNINSRICLHLRQNIVMPLDWMAHHCCATYNITGKRTKNIIKNFH